MSTPNPAAVEAATPTPRVDAEYAKYNNLPGKEPPDSNTLPQAYQAWDFARQLERELAAAQAEVADAQSANTKLGEEIARLTEKIAGQARRHASAAAVSKCVWQDHEKQFAEQQSRITALEKALTASKEALAHIQEHDDNPEKIDAAHCAACPERLMSQRPFVKDGQFLGSIEVDANDTCQHVNSTPTGHECHAGCCDQYKCADCGKVFMVECPD